MARPRGKFELSNEQIMKIFELSSSDHSMKEIAMEVNCSSRTVYRYLKRFG